MNSDTPCPDCGELNGVDFQKSGPGWEAYCWNCVDGAPDAGHTVMAWGPTQGDALAAWAEEVEFQHG